MQGLSKNGSKDGTVQCDPDGQNFCPLESREIQHLRPKQIVLKGGVNAFGKQIPDIVLVRDDSAPFLLYTAKWPIRTKEERLPGKPAAPPRQNPFFPLLKRVQGYF
jgi:hypothetical protein